MKAQVTSKVTVIAILEPGEWVTTKTSGDEVAITTVEATFYSGLHSDWLNLTSVKRNKDGKWGGRGGGYVPSKWDSAPTAVRELIMAHYSHHVDQIRVES